MTLNKNIKLTKHANERVNQRGFTKDILNFLLEFGDYHESGKDCFAVSIKRKNLNILLNSKSTAYEIKSYIKKNFEKLNKKKIIISSVIVTALNRY